jgi:hypothetical protein
MTSFAAWSRKHGAEAEATWTAAGPNWNGARRFRRFELEQSPKALFEMFFQVILVRQNLVQSTIEAVIVDLGLGDHQQVVECRSAIPIFGDM